MICMLSLNLSRDIYGNTNQFFNKQAKQIYIFTITNFTNISDSARTFGASYNDSTRSYSARRCAFFTHFIMGRKLCTLIQLSASFDHIIERVRILRHEILCNPLDHALQEMQKTVERYETLIKKLMLDNAALISAWNIPSNSAIYARHLGANVVSQGIFLCEEFQ